MGNFEARVRSLSANQRALLAKQIKAEQPLDANDKVNSFQNIVAYLCPKGDEEEKRLKELLKNKLPEYMIPSKFVFLDAFPKLPNGKIDANALKFLKDKEKPLAKVKTDIPRSEKEKKILNIWEEVLNFKPIEIDDNFFEIGGDSILSIQIVSKARKQGILLGPNQLFEHQTISELAQFARAETENEDEASAIGQVPLLPIQRWFFEEQKNAPHHWNQAVMFQPKETLDLEILRESVEHLVHRHSALRLNFTKEGDVWSSAISTRDHLDVFQTVSLTGIPEKNREKKIESHSAEFQANFKLSKSTLFQAVFFDTGEVSKSRFLLFAHHLVVDNVSWRILIEDLEAIYISLKKGDKISLLRKTVSYKKWSEHLENRSKSTELNRELEFWNSQTTDLKDFPVDFEGELPYLVENLEVLGLVVDAVATEDLIRNSNKAYNTKTEELLISALTSAFEKWKGVKRFSLGVEKHGRDGEFDFSNSVGWFTSYFLVTINVEDEAKIKSKIVFTKEQLRRVPNSGLNYGVLRYLRGESTLRNKSAVLFNYWGKQDPFRSKIFGKGKFVHEGVYSLKSERYNLIGINAFVEEGKLHVNFDFSKNFYQRSTIESLIGHFENELRKIIEHCSADAKVGYTPSDFAEAELNQEDLDSLLGQII